MDVDFALRALQQLEEGLSDLYDWFADGLTADGEAEALFRRLANEERRHTRLVQYQRRLVRSEPKLEYTLAFDAGAVVDALADVERARSRPEPPDLDGALRSACALEARAAEAHSGLILRAGEPSLAALLTRLSGEDLGHADGLRRLALARGLDPGAWGTGAAGAGGEE